MQIRYAASLLVGLLLLVAAGCALANPTPGNGVCGNPHCYWETPMDMSNPEALWEMLMQPMTVVSGPQKTQALIYAEPDENSKWIGEVTCRSQGVHVLETLDNGWSRIECYSSSNSRSRLKVFGDLVEGYIQTEKLEVAETRTKYSLVVDKLTQRMYLFEEGELLTTLRVSTGLATRWKPQNETNAGEFHLVSMVGSYVAGDDVICEHAIRFNDGDLIHNVPCEVRADGSKNYWRYEANLGQKASDGCIRVQRLRTPQDVNMTWLWHHLFDQKQTRLIIWEDCPGRQLSVPAPDTPVYVLPSVSRAYHSDPCCYCVGKAYWPMQQITYAQLEEEPYNTFGDCPQCNPPLRASEIEAINQRYAIAAAQE